ncbi:MAG: ChaN family lipoprotein [Chitinophagaceae bacterium]|nr:ChaN family lipoprotein [Chitinophagaceae bacterium]
MQRIIILFLLLHVGMAAVAQSKPAYVLYNNKGKKVSYKKMIRDLSARDVVLFGEFHNNAISHWLQLEVTKDCDVKGDLILAFEMLETDNQAAVDLYLKGQINQKGLDSMARLWKNYPTDYAPLVNYAKDHSIPVVASNIPRRYASMVFAGGFAALDTLPAQEKVWIAPLPIAYDEELPGYKKMKEMMPGHGGDNLPRAQAIKDATMAHFSLKNYQPGKLLIHFNGAYHSDNYEGILWYLQRQSPQLKYATITTVSQKDIHKLDKEHKGKADYIICVDEDMTNTY